MQTPGRNSPAFAAMRRDPHEVAVSTCYIPPSETLTPIGGTLSMKRLVLGLLVIAALDGCSSQTHSSAPAVTADNYLNQFVDSTASPRKDIFEFAVGKWLKDHPIPVSERSWGIAKVVQDETYRRLVELSEAASRSKNTS